MLTRQRRVDTDAFAVRRPSLGLLCMLPLLRRKQTMHMLTSQERGCCCASKNKPHDPQCMSLRINVEPTPCMLKQLAKTGACPASKFGTFMISDNMFSAQMMLCSPKDACDHRSARAKPVRDLGGLKVGGLGARGA